MGLQAASTENRIGHGSRGIVMVALPGAGRVVLRRPGGAGLPVSPSNNVMGKSELAQPQGGEELECVRTWVAQFHFRVTSPSRRLLLFQTRMILSVKMMAAAGAFSAQSSPGA